MAERHPKNATPQEQLLLRGAQTRENARRLRLGGRPLKPPPGFGGNLESDDGGARGGVATQVVPPFSAWEITPEAVFSLDPTAASPHSSPSPFSSGGQLPPEDMLKEMALSAVLTSPAPDGPSNASGRAQPQRVTPHVTTVSSRSNSSTKRDRESLQGVVYANNRELAVAAEETASLFREGQSSYGRRSMSGAVNTFDALMRSSVYEGMSVAIPKFQTADRGGSKHTLYTIIVKLATGHTWSVQRRYKQISTLHHAIKHLLPTDSLPSFPAKRYMGSSLGFTFVEERRAKLETYLKALVRLPEVWEVEDLAHFFDDDSKSMSLRLHYTNLLLDNEKFDKILSSSGDVLRDCAQSVRNQEQLIEQLRLRCAGQEETIRNLHVGMKKLKAEKSQMSVGSFGGVGSLGTPIFEMNPYHFVNSTKPLPIPANEASAIRRPSAGGGGKLFSVGSGGSGLAGGSSMLAMNTPAMEDIVQDIVSSPRDPLATQGGPSKGYDRASETAGAIMERNGYEGMGVLGIAQPTSSATTEPAASTTLSTNMLGGEDAWSSSGLGNSQSGLWGTGRSGHETRPAPLPFRQIPIHIERHSSDDYIESLLEKIAPGPAARAARDKVMALLHGLFVKQASAAYVCSSENSALGTYLPGEPLLLTVFVLSQEDEMKFLEVQSALCRNLLGNGKGASNNSFGREDSEEPVTVTHVSIERGVDGKLAMACTVDGISVVVKNNALRSLYLSAMLEEADQIIGKQHLVKRSIVLVRSWCTYESKAYWGNISAVLSDESIFVIVMYLFNMYHERLHFPLQVLITFLSVMSSFPWESQAMTIHGPMELMGINAGHVVAAPEQCPVRVFSEMFVERYQKKYSECQNKGNNKRSISIQDEIPISPLSILSPLNACDNLTSSMKEESAKKLRNAFIQGARTFEPIVKLVVDDCDDIPHKTWPTAQRPVATGKFGRSMVDRLNNCFPSLLQAISSSQSDYGRVTRIQNFAGEVDQFGAFIHDGDGGSNFEKDIEATYQLFTNGFSGERLMKLTKSILEEKGPMPVGEIGKVLKEKIANDRLTAILKEKFGGLKSFLEQFYGDEFVLSTNHKFNPKVYLRKSLSTNDIEEIKKGNDLTSKAGRGKSGRGKSSKAKRGHQRFLSD